MRVVIFGSTGGTGRRLIERGFARGWEVVAVARTRSLSRVVLNAGH